MNDEMVRKLAEEIAKRNFADNWWFYLLLLALAFLGSTAGAFIKAWSTKRGEVAATKADADEILRQLRETTATAKSVELTLARGDWMERERNTQKRAKLEQLVIAALAISRWVRDDCVQVMSGSESLTQSPIDEFRMVSILYFPELHDESEAVENRFLEFRVYTGQVRLDIFKITLEIESVSKLGPSSRLTRLMEQRLQLQEQEKTKVQQKAIVVAQATQELSKKARALMEQLTAQ